MGLTRRRLLLMLMVMGSAAVLAACGSAGPRLPTGIAEPLSIPGRDHARGHSPPRSPGCAPQRCLPAKPHPLQPFRQR